jgi:hypothetical protein
MDSFDVAWYTDMDANGNLYPTFRSAGSNYGLYLDPNGSTNPSWVTEANSANNPKLLLPNQAQQNQRKQIYMTVDYIDRGHSGDPSIKILDPNGTSYSPTSIGWDATGGQVLLYWDLPSQPAYEDVVFPNSDYCNLYNIKLVGSTSTVKDWDVATYCPEPAALTLLALAALALRRRR